MSSTTPRILVFVVAFLAIFHLGHSLKCYKCNGCETSSTLKETCRDVEPLTQVSACMTQKIRTGGTVEAMVVKKCVAYDKTERFECPNLPSGETVACNVCHEDFCNSGSKITTSFYVCLSIFVIMLVQKKVFF